jgi:ergot alkaloid biosynthesis protein
VSVLITGGTGKTGRRLAERLRARGQSFRIAARRPPAGPEGRGFDWSARETWEAALDEISALYIVAPASGADAADVIDFMRLAVARGVRRFVLLSSSLLPIGGPGPGQVHQWLSENAAEWAVLRPSWFMQNFSEGPHRATIVAEDTIYSAADDGKVAFISADDIAAVAYVALTGAEPLNADLVLTGGATLDYDEVAAFISVVTGRKIAHMRIDAEALAARHRANGLPASSAQILAMMDGLIANGAENRITRDVETLTGTPPVAFERFCRENAGAWSRA